jgi:hypothetical protein
MIFGVNVRIGEILVFKFEDTIQKKMKNQTQNTNQGKRNFFQKINIGILFLAFLFLSNSANAQWRVRAVNNAPLGCDWIVTVYEAGSPPFVIGTHTSNGLSGSTLSVCSTTGTPDYVTVTDVAGNCTMITFGSGGVFNYTTVSPSCSPSSCASQITCSGGMGIAPCGTVMHILIEIN